jgi:hypothetical protein
MEAAVKGIKGNTYILVEIQTGAVFHIDVAVMHEKVVFPPDIIDEDGFIKALSQVSVIMKRTKSGNIVYLPDSSRYPLKNRDQSWSLKNGDTNSVDYIVAGKLIDLASKMLNKQIKTNTND